MTTALSQAVQDAIQKDLPGLAANELKDFIAKAQATEKELERTKAELVAKADKVAALEAKLAEHRELDVREKALADIAATQQANELSLLRREAQLDAQVARAELNGVKDTVGSFLRNVTVRQTVVSDITKPVEGYPGSQYNSGAPGTLQRNYDGKPDTTTQTETKE